MAIKHLTDEQVRDWTVEQKDRWWLENVYRGNVPQFTLRAAVAGFGLGFILSLTNLYVGAKTGWSLGVGITSVILAYAMFKALGKIGIGRGYHVLENNIVQSIACAAGYMTAPLISSLAAYMMIKGEVVPMHHAWMWLIGLALLGVLFAFPMKRRFLNDEQLPFPEGRAAGVVMDTLHSESGGDNIAPKALIWSAVAAGLATLGQAERLLEHIKLHFRIPAHIEQPLYAACDKLGWTPSVLGTKLEQLTVRAELDIAMIGAGGLMGIRTGVALLVGACLNYLVLAPIMIEQGDIMGTISGGGETMFGFRRITYWALWGGVAMMTTASLYSFFSKPAVILRAFGGLMGGKRTDDCLKHIELPMGVFVFGIPFVGMLVVMMAANFFGVPWHWAVIAIPLVFVFCLISANSTALTSITPTGAMGKLTQLTFAALAPGQIHTNLITAGITGEVAGNSSNLLQNIKPGYMLGAKPRLQALGHVLGAFSGATAAVLVFYPLMLKNDPANLINEDFPMPAAAIWKAVAELLTEGFSALPVTAIWAAGIGAALGIFFEVLKSVTKGKVVISGVGLGLAFVIPFTTCLAMFFGSFIFWWLGRRYPDPESRTNKVAVQNQEAICAGVIAGAALVGIALMAINTFVLPEESTQRKDTYAAIAVCATDEFPDQPTDRADQILFYVSGARNQGHVRRLWPEGQAYVNDILAVDAQLQQHLDHLRSYWILETLWTPSDPRWQDKATRSAQHTKLRQVIEGERVDRDTLRAKLRETIDKLPDGLDLGSRTAEASFADAVFQTLAIPQEEELTQAATLMRELFARVDEQGDLLDPQHGGLHFTDGEVNTRLRDQYDTLTELLEARRDAIIPAAEATLIRTTRTLQGVDARQQRHLYQYLVDRRTALRNGLTQIPKDLLSLITKTEEEIEELKRKAAQAGDPDEATTLDRKISALEKDLLPRIEHRREAMLTRVQAILDKARSMENETVDQQQHT